MASIAAASVGVSLALAGAPSAHAAPAGPRGDGPVPAPHARGPAPARAHGRPGAGIQAAAAPAADYVPGVVLVGYRQAPSPALIADVASTARARPTAAPAADDSQLLRLPAGESVTTAVARLRRLPDVAYAVPDYIAHVAGSYIPDDPGRGHTAGGWERLQWNFLSPAGVSAPGAWSNLIADAAPGGRGTTVAILDTGVAFRNWISPTGRVFLESPDFDQTRFVAPCDLVVDQGAGSMRHGRVVSHCSNPYALDRQGHGTFVAGVVAESTDNGIGVTGLAYGAAIMPVRVLDAQGNGDARTIARGIRYAVVHGAKVINLSLEFDPSVQAGDIPGVIDAIVFAHRHGVIVVAAAGNDSDAAPYTGQLVQMAYPARDPLVISVGATTRDRCLADYSDIGPGLDLVAPGGGDDTSLLPGDPDCNPLRNLPDIYQMTFVPNPGNPNELDPTRFGLPGGWYGTSMASPEVAAAAAMVVASGVLGSNPSPDQVLSRLETTATALGGLAPNVDYGYGLLNAAAATDGTSLTARAHRHHHHKPAHHRKKKRKRKPVKRSG